MAKRNNGIRPGKSKFYGLISRNENNDENSCHRIIPEPQLMWPFYDFDSDDYAFNQNDKIVFCERKEFIGFDEHKKSIDRILNWEVKKNQKLLRINGVFYREILNSKIAYIVDNFFSSEEFVRLINCIMDSKGYLLKELYIICDKDYNGIIKKKIELENEGRIANIEINISSMAKVSKRYFDIHDRFALLDDEIWHFGWTVCGIGHNLNAYSRGWIDLEGKFKEYLDGIVSSS